MLRKLLTLVACIDIVAAQDSGGRVKEAILVPQRTNRVIARYKVIIPVIIPAVRVRMPDNDPPKDKRLKTADDGDGERYSTYSKEVLKGNKWSDDSK